MPEIIIQPDGDLLVPRGYAEDNEFFMSLLESLVDKDTHTSLANFFEISEQSEVLFGNPGLCG